MENIKIVKDKRNELEFKINQLVDAFYKDNLKHSGATISILSSQPVVNEDLVIGRKFKSEVKITF